jgi:aminopeptidase N
MKFGDNKFTKVFRYLITKQRFGNASSKDWIEVATEVSGQKTQPFFDAWQYADKVPKLSG